MKNKNMFIIIFCVLIIILTVLIIILNKKSSRDIDSGKISTTNQIERYDTNTIEEIKSEINAKAETDMYEIQEEYDGRKIIQIRQDLQYETILAGIIKNDKPKEDEINKILESRPTKRGIWISEKSREDFLRLLKQNNISGYEINEDGYLCKLDGANSDKITSAIESSKQYIFDISGKVYQRDELSGEIIEYPFEEMEPDQILESYSIENSIILEITTNSRGILSEKEILKEILINIE